MGLDVNDGLIRALGVLRAVAPGEQGALRSLPGLHRRLQPIYSSGAASPLANRSVHSASKANTQLI